MSSLSIIKIYFSVNALLICSYILFIALNRIARRASFISEHRQLICVAQALIFFSVVTPFVFHAIPEQHLPLVEWRGFRPAPEGHVSTFNQSGTQSYVQTSVVKKTSRLQKELSSATSTSALNTVLLVLCAGFLITSTRLLRSFLKLRALIQAATPIRSLGHVSVVISELISIPFSVRLGRRSWVVLPNKILENSGDFRLALRHELQHHRQGDTSWAIFVELLICFFFPNPAMFFWKKEITELQEFSCDEALIGRKGLSSHEYGSCLVRVAEAALGNREMYAGTTCMATGLKNPIFFKSFLRRRIEMFTHHGRPQTQRWAGLVVGTTATLFTIALAFGAEQSLRQRKINPGSVVVDASIQKIAELSLTKAIKQQNAKAGFVIVADPNTGKILAVANIDTTKKLKGYWALSHLSEPASFTKTIVAAQAIEKGVTTPYEEHACENGNYQYGDRVYHDWKKTGWAHLTTQQTIMFSSDICSIKIGEKIGADGLRQMLTDFGFGPAGTAKAFPEAQAGQLPPQDDPKRPRLVPYVSSGFGFRVTPLEMLQAYGAIANGGNLLMPRPANAPDADVEIVRRVLSPESAEKTREILRQVVLEGTAKDRASSDLYTMAGKTASSFSAGLMELDWMHGNRKSDVAGFIGFAPVKNPRIEVYVGIQDPKISKTGAHGSEHAAPVFKEVAEEVLKHLKVAPDKTQES